MSVCRKKIGIDARMCGAQFTGIGRLTKELIERLPKLMPDCQFVIFLNRTAYQNFNPQTKNIKKVLANEKIYTKDEQISFLKKINREQCDLMYFLHFNVPLFYNRPFVVVIHDLTLMDFPGKRMNKWWHRLVFRLVFQHAIRCAKGIATVSEFTKNELCRRFHIASQKVRTIYNGIDERFFKTKQKDIKKKMGISKDFFLYTGVWREHKNILGLIEAFAKLDLDAELIITGGANNLYAQDVRAKIKQEGVADKVKLVGLVSESDLRQLFKNARAFVFPSFSEGFGLPLLEAMASKVPIASSNVSCLPEIAGDAVLFFDPYNTNDMARKMKRIFTDEKLRARLVKRGLERVKYFNWNSTAQLSKDFLCAIL